MSPHSITSEATASHPPEAAGQDNDSPSSTPNLVKKEEQDDEMVDIGNIATHDDDEGDEVDLLASVKSENVKKQDLEAVFDDMSDDERMPEAVLEEK
jgi:hypothetical protein